MPCLGRLWPRGMQYRFAFGMDREVKYEIEDDLYSRGPMTVITTVRPDVFMLLPDPNDEECRYITQSGNIEFEFADSVLKVCEDCFIIFLARQITLARPTTKKESISIWKNMNRKYMDK